jgi:hypothetical protein
MSGFENQPGLPQWFCLAFRPGCRLPLSVCPHPFPICPTKVIPCLKLSHIWTLFHARCLLIALMKEAINTYVTPIYFYQTTRHIAEDILKLTWIFKTPCGLHSLAQDGFLGQAVTKSVMNIGSFKDVELLRAERLSALCCMELVKMHCRFQLYDVR